MKRQLFSAMLFLVIAVCLVVFSFTYFQAADEEERLTDELERRSLLLAESLRESIEPYVISENTAQLQRLVERFSDRERLLGLIVYDNKDKILAASSVVSTKNEDIKSTALLAMDEDKTNTAFVDTEKNKNLYILAMPFHSEDSVIGSIIVVHNAAFIDVSVQDIWKDGIVRAISYSLIVAVAFLLIVHWIVSKPVVKLIESIRTLRISGGSMGMDKSNHFFQPILHEVSSIHQSLLEAQNAASYEARLRLEKLDSPWTAERLKEFVKDVLKDRKFYIVSNREPYIHNKKGNEISFIQPASGMVTALEPVMMASSGTWIAHGSGDADKAVVNKEDKIMVPPNDPKYTLKRIWLTDKEEQGYYYGFSNDGLWPLCHNAYVSPVFRKEDWEEYKKVNGKFAKEILHEIRSVEKPIIFIQDYHFTLLPKMIKESRPDAAIALFWHIPWPSSGSFRVCPWTKEVLDGMLGADLLAFHTQLHCINFIDTVGKELESLIDLEQFSVQRGGHASFVKPFPIGIPFSVSENDSLKADERDTFLAQLGITPTEFMGVGVDRMDYTKGLVERFRAIELFFKKYPEYKERFTFIQIAPNTRTQIPSYQRFANEVDSEVKKINEEYKTKQWKPIVFINKHQNREEINKIYQLGNVCLVTSLHDGMNLVAKEYVAARVDKKGTLILSQYAGASRELKDAIIINPYNLEEVAEAIRTALEMPVSEQTKRMIKLRDSVEINNVYRWFSEILKTIIQITS